ncbi:isochorismate synthase (plasmid) [Bradyrhizobium sp. Pa8]|uniref:isochorismate synthase n=1 Tax=Bradyrhizobium sp. Pa8 TaxID=3386552 RepID=UPI00403F8C51
MILQLNPSDLLRCLMEAQCRAGEHRSRVLASYSVPWTSDDHVGLFASNRLFESPATLWAVPRRELALLELGCAHEFRGRAGAPWAAIQQQWQRLMEGAVIHGDHRPVLCGGFAFDRLCPRRSRWRDFPMAALTLARFCLFRRGSATRLVINTLVTATSDCAALANGAVANWARIVSRRSPAPRVAALREPLEPDIAADTWKRKVAAAIERIRAGAMDKVVLARTRTVPLTVSVEDILSSLSETHPDAYLFAFARHDACFLGASPERLIEFSDGRLSTWALAGSAPRSAVPTEDTRLGVELLRSTKDRHEHALVVHELRSVLIRYCRRLQIAEEPRLCKLPHVQHLITPIEGQAHDGLQLLAVIEQLHPSPAVGGLPRAGALAYIREQEELDRGWYAGPVGWIDDRGEGEFAVALRSALLRGGCAALFAGCGIVDDSSPDDEYRETEVKMRTMASALNGQ